MNFLRRFKRVYTFEALTSRRVVGAFEYLGKRFLPKNTKTNAKKDRMRLHKRQKKTNIEWYSHLNNELKNEYFTPQK